MAGAEPRPRVGPLAMRCGVAEHVWRACSARSTMVQGCRRLGSALSNACLLARSSSLDHIPIPRTASSSPSPTRRPVSGEPMDPSADHNTEPAPVVLDTAPGPAMANGAPHIHSYAYSPPTLEQPAVVLPAAPGMGGPPAPPMMPPGYATAPVPPVPPAKGRGAGFWVGVSAAVAAACVLLLLGGFFIGRSTRLSDDQVQTKINQQAQADKIATQKALTDQAEALRAERVKLVRRAADRARGRGLRQGRSEGRDQGFDDGQAQGFQTGQSSGYAQGQNDGYESGISDGSCLANYFAC